MPKMKQTKKTNWIPIYEPRKPKQNVALEGNSELLIRKRVEDYQLISSNNKNNHTYDTCNSTNSHGNAKKLQRQPDNQEALYLPPSRNDKKTNSVKFNKSIDEKDREVGNKVSSGYRETPFKKIEKIISLSSASNGKKQSNQPKNIFSSNIPKPEWLLMNRKTKGSFWSCDNKKEAIIIQTFWRGYALRKKLFNELRIFYQSNQFVCYIEDVEKRKNARDCFNKLRNPSTNNDYETGKTNSIIVDNQKIYNKVLPKNDESKKLKGKLVDMLLRRIVNHKYGTGVNSKRNCFDQWYMNCMNSNSNKLRSRVRLKHHDSSLNDRNSIKAYNDSLRISKNVCLVQYQNKDKKNAIMQNSISNKEYISNDNQRESMGFYKNEDMLLIVRKHLKLNAVIASYKQNILWLWFMRWKESGDNFSSEDLQRLKALYYVKIISRNLFRFYSRKVSNALNKWLKNTVLIRKQFMKQDYTSCLTIEKTIITAYKKNYLNDVAYALKSKMPQSDDKCIIF